MRGDFLQELCCTQIRCSLPTSAKRNMPFVINLFGLTFWFQSRPLFAAIATVGELKDLCAEKEIESDARRKAHRREGARPSSSTEESRPEGG